MDTIAIFVLTSVGLGASAVVLAVALVAIIVSLGGLFIEVLLGIEASWQRLTALRSTANLSTPLLRQNVRLANR